MITFATTFILLLILSLFIFAIGWDARKVEKERWDRLCESMRYNRRCRLYPYFGWKNPENYEVAEKEGEFFIAYREYVYPYNPNIHIWPEEISDSDFD